MSDSPNASEYESDPQQPAVPACQADSAPDSQPNSPSPIGPIPTNSIGDEPETPANPALTDLHASAPSAQTEAQTPPLDTVTAVVSDKTHHLDLDRDENEPLDAAIRELVGDVESRLARLREMSERSAAAVAKADEEHERLHAMREALAREARSLDEARDAHAREIEETRNALARRKQDIDATATALEERAVKITSVEAALKERGEEIVRRRNEIEQAEQEIEAKRNEVGAQAAEIEAFARRSEAEHEQWQSAARDARAQEVAHFEDLLFDRANEIAALEKKIEQAEAQSAAAELQVHELAERLQATERELENQAAAFRAQQEQLQSEGADRASEEAAHAAALESLGNEITDRDRRIRLLESEIEQTRQEAIGLQDRIEVLESQDTSGSAGSAPAAAAGAAIGSALNPGEDSDKREQEIASLKSGIEQRDDAIAKLSGHIRGLQHDLQSLQEAQERRRRVEGDAADGANADGNSVIDIYETRINELERENQRLADRVEKLRTAEVVKQTHAADPARRAASIADKDTQFVARRRRRLARQRRLMAERVERVQRESRAFQQRLEHARKVEQQQTQVGELYRALVAAERHMIQRWAGARATTLAFFFVLTTIAVGMAAYVGVLSFWPSAFQSSARIEAQARPGFPLTEQQAAFWQTAHEGLAFSDAVVDNFNERLRQQGGTSFSGSRAQALAFLEESLVVQGIADGVLELRLTTEGRDRSRRLLDTYTMAFVSTANAQRAHRTDHARTVIDLPAEADMDPVDDQRPIIAGYTFGGSMLLVICIGSIAFLRLRRTPGLLEDLLLDDDESTSAEDAARKATGQAGKAATSPIAA